MFRITKITFVYKNGVRKTEKPEYLVRSTKMQLEALRKKLISKHNCKSIVFTYEERR